jgi:diaminopimelate epimerase
MYMYLSFSKYQGTGNDFILVDDRSRHFPVNQSFIERLCERHFGIGADGLILLRSHREFDFEMVYFNADGRESSMCGNGGRCIVQFAHSLDLFQNRTFFLATDGPHEAYLEGALVRLRMQDVTQIAQHEGFDFLHTGSPHYVEFVEDVHSVPVLEKGRQVRQHPRFAASGGTNVNFVQYLDKQTLFVRTYERGVEAETYSCGTGVTAAALAAALRHMKSPVSIQTLGGSLEVSFDQDAHGSFSNIYLTGPAREVYRGVLDLELEGLEKVERGAEVSTQ